MSCGLEFATSCASPSNRGSTQRVFLHCQLRSVGPASAALSRAGYGVRWEKADVGFKQGPRWVCGPAWCLITHYWSFCDLRGLESDFRAVSPHLLPLTDKKIFQGIGRGAGAEPQSRVEIQHLLFSVIWGRHTGVPWRRLSLRVPSSARSSGSYPSRGPVRVPWGPAPPQRRHQKSPTLGAGERNSREIYISQLVHT